MADLLLALGGLLLLVFGADIMVRGAVSLALRARMSPLVVGLTVVSIGTSAPELLVSVMAALRGDPAIAVGNVVGSNIANISLVLGAAILIFPVAVDREARRIHWPVMMAASLLSFGLLGDDQLLRWEGGMLTVLAIAYVAMLVTRARSAELPAERNVSTMALGKAVMLVIAGVAAAGLGADLFVRGASGMARLLGASEQLIGLTVVAVGTSLPELVTSVVAAFRKQPDISLGNLIGSNIFNLLGILGATAIISPIKIVPGSFTPDLLAMCGMALLLWPMMRWGSGLGRSKGMVLMLAYGAYIMLVLQRG